MAAGHGWRRAKAKGRPVLGQHKCAQQAKTTRVNRHSIKRGSVSPTDRLMGGRVGRAASAGARILYTLGHQGAVPGHNPSRQGACGGGCRAPGGRGRLTWRVPPPAAGSPTWPGACGRQTGRPPRRRWGQSRAAAAARPACWRLHSRCVGSWGAGAAELEAVIGRYSRQPPVAKTPCQAVPAYESSATPLRVVSNTLPVCPHLPHAPAPASARSDSTPVTVLCAACSRLSTALSFRSLAVSSAGARGTDSRVGEQLPTTGRARELWAGLSELGGHLHLTRVVTRALPAAHQSQPPLLPSLALPTTKWCVKQTRSAAPSPVTSRKRSVAASQVRCCRSSGVMGCGSCASACSMCRENSSGLLRGEWAGQSEGRVKVDAAECLGREGLAGRAAGLPCASS